MPSIPVPHKKRGRPATGHTPRIGVRLPDDARAAIDEWRLKQSPVPNQSDAIRLLIERGLNADRYVDLIDKSLDLVSDLMREEDKTKTLALRVIEILGNYKPSAKRTREFQAALAELATKRN